MKIQTQTHTLRQILKNEATTHISCRRNKAVRIAETVGRSVSESELLLLFSWKCRRVSQSGLHGHDNKGGTHTQIPIKKMFI